MEQGNLMSENRNSRRLISILIRLTLWDNAATLTPMKTQMHSFIIFMSVALRWHRMKRSVRLRKE